MIENLNRYLFTMINAPANPGGAILAFARFSANWVIYIMAALLVLGWIRGGYQRRINLFAIGLSAALALALNFLIASVFYHPRPFEIGLGHQFVAHLAETSFPSDHATVLFAVAFSAIMAIGGRWGLLALVAALTVAWSRIYLGIHWPLDMLGSAMVAAIAVTVVQLALGQPVQRLAHHASAIYDRLIAALHLPARLFPPAGQS